MGKVKEEDKAADAMCKVLSKNWWIHKIEKDLKKILKDLDIFVGKPIMEVKTHSKFKPECFVSCVVKAENNIFGKDINIMIKPDLGKKHRVLREAIQENSNIDIKAEDFDDEKSDTIEIFVREFKELKKDIKEALRRFKQRELAA